MFSGNIVGYTKVTVYPGNNMFGAAFGEIGDGVNQDFQKMFIDAEGIAKGAGTYINADTIQVWDPLLGSSGSYVTYYYYIGGDSDDYNWFFTNDYEINDPMPVVQGFWYNSKNSAPVVMTVAGQVNTEETTSVDIYPGINLIAFPYPTEFDVNNDVDWELSGAKGAGTYINADTIQVWNPLLGSSGSYVTYYYYIGGDSDDYNWFFTNDYEINDPIPAVQGFWYDHKGAGFTLEFVRPFPID